MKKKQLIIVLTITLALLPIVSFAAFDLIDPWGAANSLDIGQAGEQSLAALIIVIVNFILGLLALIAVALIIYAGFSYMFSAGNEEKIKKARGTLGTTVIGLIIIMMSWAVANYAFTVLNRATGGDSSTGGPGPNQEVSAECISVGGRVCANACDSNDENDCDSKTCEELRKHEYCDYQDIYCDETWRNLKGDCKDSNPNDFKGTCMCKSGWCCGPG